MCLEISKVHTKLYDKLMCVRAINNMIWYPESCMGSDICFPTMWYVRPAKPQISLRKAQSEQSLCKSLEYSMVVKLLSEHHLEFLSIKVGCTGSSESTHVKMHCWKSHATVKLW